MELVLKSLDRQIFGIFSVQGLKQGDALSPLLFKFVFGYFIRDIEQTKRTESEWDPSLCGRR
jgi:hypothetical protein